MQGKVITQPCNPMIWYGIAGNMPQGLCWFYKVSKLRLLGLTLFEYVLVCLEVCSHSVFVLAFFLLTIWLWVTYLLFIFVWCNNTEVFTWVGNKTLWISVKGDVSSYGIMTPHGITPYKSRNRRISVQKARSGMVRRKLWNGPGDPQAWLK